MKKQLFRQSALDRLSSPDQLDVPFRIVRPASWVALAAVTLLLALLIWWGFFGTVATKVTGQGILLREGALEEASSPGDGQLNVVLVDVDDRVETGQVVARISQPDLIHSIAELEAKLDLLELERDTGEEMGDDRKSLESEYLARRRQTLTASLQVARERAASLKEQLERYDELFRKKYITRSQYLDVKEKYNGALQDILSRREELARVPMTAVDSSSQLEREKMDVDMRIMASKEQLRALRDRLELESVIRSPADGRVLEVFKTRGQVIRSGEALLSVEKEDDGRTPLYLHAFVQPRQGKKISAGMEAQVSPSVVKQEEFGVILGQVTRVSRFPASSRGMKRVLGNDELVKSLSQGGSPITLTVAMRRSMKTETGYEWSSGGGPPLTLQSGTLAGVTVVVRRQAPVTLVLPFLKNFFLGVGEEPHGEDPDD
ncbi:NHLP bacteriocin system secretion protein [Dethiosulfovibrio sp. F2B]|uniref:NHLP bacteriocin system secretion protein n=1 Tax=Dethiosulfovibrio faecalis TaxID=2720018 RepID=UPI001F46A64F|nr:NHLP bacteriocin system secretion protein [Dethiosulfovibrio faecalis]MCF4151070.1 NHLP bacteriocin system secretion protein [Dethiosulfovibrio faecalis]